MYLVDTHSHVLPFFDDGSENWDMSLEMLRQAQHDGIVEIICTPHILSERDLERENEVVSLRNELIRKAGHNGINIKINYGAELYVQPNLELNQKMSTLAQNGKYFLVEFPMSMIPDFVADRFFSFLIEGKVPIIAHPERNGGIINNPQKAYDFVERGALLQVTAGSLLGVFGLQVKNAAFQLMEANLVHVVATDAHNLTSRPLKLRAAYNLVRETWGLTKANLLFIENPRKLIAGEQIYIGTPKPVVRYGGHSFQEKVKLFLKKIS